ncbi:IS3 family transposase [Catenibacterium sp.]|uniref:IS3 family transposase n=1 Tax=Catenibacterium sp. TaxID=2049022 RepID=UPI00399327BD
MFQTSILSNVFQFFFRYFLYLTGTKFILAPESFFGRMKTEVIDIIARCGDIDTVRRLIDGYINMHNNERYQDTPCKDYLQVNSIHTR